jgi:hypothetical protein
MKRLAIVGLLISFATLIHAMEGEKKEKLLTFIKAQKGEDLSTYQAILLKVYPTFVDSDNKQKINESILNRFTILSNWIGQKNKLFVKIEDQ